MAHGYRSTRWVNSQGNLLRVVWAAPLLGPNEAGRISDDIVVESDHMQQDQLVCPI